MKEPVSHYGLLHEAAFFDQAEAAVELLTHGADLVDRNIFDQTPLHVAAKQGSVAIAKVLSKPMIRGRRNLWALGEESLSMVDNRGLTPLATAVDFSRFPYEKLFWLAERTMDSILLVAKRSPLAVKDLIRDHNQSMKRQRVLVHKSWRQVTEGDGDVTRGWIRLMHHAPQTATDLLEAVTVEPKTKNEQHHPLPRRATVGPPWALKTQYCD